MSTTTGTQISDHFAVQDQSNNNVQDSKINSNQHQVDEDDDRQPVLAVFSKRVQLNSSVRNSLSSLLREEAPYDEILKEFDLGHVEVIKKENKYKKKSRFLLVHREGQNKGFDIAEL